MEDIGLMALRVVVGLLFIGHGAQKLFGWFGGDGVFGTADWFRSLGLRPALFWAVISGLTELGGGTLAALGLLMPLGPLAILASMLVATITVHWANGLWAEQGGFELPLTNMAIALRWRSPARAPTRSTRHLALPCRCPVPCSAARSWSSWG